MSLTLEEILDSKPETPKALGLRGDCLSWTPEKGWHIIKVRMTKEDLEE